MLRTLARQAMAIWVTMVYPAKAAPAVLMAAVVARQIQHKLLPLFAVVQVWAPVVARVVLRVGLRVLGIGTTKVLAVVLVTRRMVAQGISIFFVGGL